jgi:hypothetical protein
MIFIQHEFTIAHARNPFTMMDRSIATLTSFFTSIEQRFSAFVRARIGLGHRALGFRLVVGAMVFMAGFGCRPEQEIVKHRIPKSQSGLEALQEPAQPIAQTPTTEKRTPTDRMVVAIFSLDDATWFFKLNGTIEQVEKTQSQWKPFLESVAFANGQPTWKLPEGWTEGDEKPMRFATLRIDDFDPPLELAISSLGSNQDLLLNVNRWRGQMGLSPISQSELDQDTSNLASPTQSAVLFDVVGNLSGGGMMAPFANRGDVRPPFAGSNSSNVPPRISTPPPASDSKFRFDTPAGWELGATSGMVPVRLQTSVDGKKVQITVIGLPAAANRWEPNAQRWASQAGLDSLTDEELESLTSPIKIDGASGKLIKLINSTADSQAIIAGMVKRGETAWFVKLTGDEPLVSDSEATFGDFLKSLKFPAE